jgi:F-type H+-transporting ATPase subunit delta
MKETKIAGRYAKALFDLAIEKNQLDSAYQDVLLIHKICNENRDFILMLKSPVIKESKKTAVLKSIFEKNLHDLTYKFLLIITLNKRESLIADIALRFIDYYKEHKHILPATLITAVQLDSQTKEKIMSLLGERTGSTIELTEIIDENVIGGFVLQFADKQYDASMLRKIKNLQKEFDINLYLKGF